MFSLLSNYESLITYLYVSSSSTSSSATHLLLRHPPLPPPPPPLPPPSRCRDRRDDRDFDRHPNRSRDYYDRDRDFKRRRSPSPGYRDRRYSPPPPSRRSPPPYKRSRRGSPRGGGYGPDDRCDSSFCPGFDDLLCTIEVYGVEFVFVVFGIMLCMLV